LEKDAYDTATGRLMLAWLPGKELESVIDKFGVPDPDVWLEGSNKEGLLLELEKIREAGVSFQLNNNHVVGFAVPVLKENSVIASLSVYMPEMRFHGETKNIVLNQLKQAAWQINNNLAEISAKF
jgi:IclR family KDG regulon transcriptional repressor